jgi:hypothetical protein
MTHAHGGETPAPRTRPDDPDTDATRATRAQVEAESNTSPRTLADLDAPRSDAPETRDVPPAPGAPDTD